jgi:hypothetical protein
MSLLWIILGLGCVGLVLAMIALVVYANVHERRGIAYVKEHGSPTIGWIVQANDNLYQDGQMPSYPAFVLISPDKETASHEEFMTNLAGEIMELKGEECEDEDEQRISKLVTDEKYGEGKRDRLPQSFTEGREVYLAHIIIFRDHLPKQKLTESFVHCQVVWNEPGTLVISIPGPKKPNRNRD